MARASIQRSRADHIKEELNAVSGDMKSTWRVAQSLLHTGRKTVYDDADSKKLATTFSQFFTEKISQHSDGTTVIKGRHFPIRQHVGPTLASFQPVTTLTDEVRRLVSRMQSKSSPLDVLPCTLLKSCADVFAPAITRLDNMSFQSGKFPACYRRAQVYCRF